MSILNLAGRVVALIVGILGSVVALFITLITVVAFHTDRLLNPSDAASHSHGFIGFLLFIVGVIGSVMALLSPTLAAVLLLIAGLGMLYVAGGWGVIPLIILGIAAALAFLDRGRARA